MFYKARNSVIEFFDDYSSMVSETKLKANNKTSGKRLKILTPKQMPESSGKLFITCISQKKSLKKYTAT